MPDALPLHPSDPRACHAERQLAPSTQRRIRALDEVIELQTTLMRLITDKTVQRAEALEPDTNPANPPVPVMAKVDADAMEGFAKSIRYTVALAEQLEHPTEPPAPAAARKPARPIVLEIPDPAQLPDADLEKHKRFYEFMEARERERAEIFAAQEEERLRIFIDVVSEICRTLALTEIPPNTPWRERLLLQLTALAAFANAHSARPPPDD
jgi:hypothetical protein